MLYTCPTCKYVFRAARRPERCPDCGKLSPRPALEDEQDWYHRIEKEKQAYQQMHRRCRFSAG